MALFLWKFVSAAAGPRHDDPPELLQQQILEDARQQGPVAPLSMVDAEPTWSRFNQIVHPGPKQYWWWRVPGGQAARPARLESSSLW